MTSKETSPQPESLIQAAQDEAAAQPFLFEISDEQAFEALEKHGEFTAERLFDQRPKIYSLVVRMIAEGLGVRQICHACGVSHHTVEAVRQREAKSVATEKEELLVRVRSAVRLCVERVQELAPYMDARDAAVAFGILAEKMLLLGGEPTVIIAQDDRVKHADFNALIEALPRANVVEIGFAAEAGKQTAPSSPPPPAAGALAHAAAGAPAPECQSDAFLCNEPQRNA